MLLGVLFCLASRSNQAWHEANDEACLSQVAIAQAHAHAQAQQLMIEPEQPTSTSAATCTTTANSTNTAHNSTTTSSSGVAAFVTASPTHTQVQNNGATIVDGQTQTQSSQSLVHLAPMSSVPAHLHAHQSMHSPDGPSLGARHVRVTSIGQLVRRSSSNKLPASQAAARPTLSSRAQLTERTPLLATTAVSSSSGSPPASSHSVFPVDQPVFSPALSTASSHDFTSGVSAHSSSLQSWSIDHFTWRFILLCILHMVFSNMNHCFGYVSTDILHDKFKSTVSTHTQQQQSRKQ